MRHSLSTRLRKSKARRSCEGAPGAECGVTRQLHCEPADRSTDPAPQTAFAHFDATPLSHQISELEIYSATQRFLSQPFFIAEIFTGRPESVQTWQPLFLILMRRCPEIVTTFPKPLSTWWEGLADVIRRLRVWPRPLQRLEISTGRATHDTEGIGYDAANVCVPADDLTLDANTDCHVKFLSQKSTRRCRNLVATLPRR